METAAKLSSKLEKNLQDRHQLMMDIGSQQPNINKSMSENAMAMYGSYKHQPSINTKLQNARIGAQFSSG